MKQKEYIVCSECKYYKKNICRHPDRQNKYDKFGAMVKTKPHDYCALGKK